MHIVTYLVSPIFPLNSPLLFLRDKAVFYQESKLFQAQMCGSVSLSRSSVPQQEVRQDEDVKTFLASHGSQGLDAERRDAAFWSQSSKSAQRHLADKLPQPRLLPAGPDFTATNRAA